MEDNNLIEITKHRCYSGILFIFYFVFSSCKVENWFMWFTFSHHFFLFSLSLIFMQIISNLWQQCNNVVKIYYSNSFFLRFVFVYNYKFIFSFNCFYYYCYISSVKRNGTRRNSLVKRINWIYIVHCISHKMQQSVCALFSTT